MQDEAPTNLKVAERIARILADSRIPVLVIGAVAFAAHRYVRFTEETAAGSPTRTSSSCSGGIPRWI